MGVFPFLFISTVLFRRGKRIEAYLFLFIPLTLPVEYDIITSITRGFTSGLFFCSLLIYPLLNPTKLWSFVIAALAVSCGYLFNANSLVLRSEEHTSELQSRPHLVCRLLLEK